MITVEPVSVDWVATRFTAPKLTLDKTVEAWKVKDDGVPVLVMGVIRHQLIGYAEMWLILADGFQYHKWPTLRAVRRLAAMAKERYSGLVARTPEGREERFARFCGLREIGRDGELVRWEL